jgi:hypothetical protein
MTVLGIELAPATLTRVEVGILASRFELIPQERYAIG